MALKRRKVEPTYASIIAQCPNAVTNPKTDALVHPQSRLQSDSEGLL